MTLAPNAAHARSQSIERATNADSVGELFRVASERLRRLVPFDAAVWLASDPRHRRAPAPAGSRPRY